MKIDQLDREVLKRYRDARKAIAKRAYRTTALVHLLSLLRHCGDDSIEVCPMALAIVADLVDAAATTINELLDQWLYVGDAEAVLEG
ncbi:hypothetical protein [Pontiella sulfatireligans]|uniref:Uncharacterized protein n=1 Tax=Pontiella sulfatireligans TaxID=2750658 RepID=A0A6C2UPC7_9BACT|nr:hypothetical protein [Pontiella sulfatireligans]VGO21121.1 hypothetical protein SCARR_03191 [Pontiella sulfatireligans]